MGALSSPSRSRPLAVAPAARVIEQPVARGTAAASLVLAVCAWGFGWPVNKLLLQAVPPLWTVAIRSLIATAALFAIAAATRRLVVPRRGDLPIVLSIALLHMTGYSVLVALGLQLVPTGRSVVLAYTTPVWVVPGARLFLGEALTARRLIGAGLGLAGLAVLFNPLGFDWADRRAVLGNLALLGAALLWAANILHIRGHRWQSTAFELVPWEALLASLVVVPIAFALGGPLAVAWNAQVALLLLYAGIPATALTYWAAATANRGLPAATMSLGLLGVPLISIAVAALCLGEAPSVAVIVAAILILCGVAAGTTR